jgi:hypothetical protein
MQYIGSAGQQQSGQGSKSEITKVIFHNSPFKVWS